MHIQILNSVNVIKTDKILLYFSCNDLVQFLNYVKFWADKK